MSGSRRKGALASRLEISDVEGAAERPVTLQSLAEHGCVLAPTGPVLPGQPLTLLPGSLQGSVVLGDCEVQSLQVMAHVQEGEGFYVPYEPLFTNVCGSKQMAGSSHLQRIISPSLPEKSSGAAKGAAPPTRNPALLCKNVTDFGTCYELLSLFGNVAVRVDESGRGMISFKGARETRDTFDLLETLYGASFIEECARCSGAPPPPGASSDDMYDGFFSVHMAVVTSNIGRRLKVRNPPRARALRRPARARYR